MNTSRAHCIDLLYAVTPLYVTREQFEKTLEGWDLCPYFREDGSVGMVFATKDAEFHFAKFDSEMTITRLHIRNHPGALIKSHGYALTKTPHAATRQQRFNERLGFYKVGEDEFCIHYRIDQLRKKESACHS